MQLFVIDYVAATFEVICCHGSTRTNLLSKTRRGERLSNCLIAITLLPSSHSTLSRLCNLPTGNAQHVNRAKPLNLSHMHGDLIAPYAYPLSTLSSLQHERLRPFHWLVTARVRDFVALAAAWSILLTSHFRFFIHRPSQHHTKHTHHHAQHHGDNTTARPQPIPPCAALPQE